MIVTALNPYLAEYAGFMVDSGQDAAAPATLLDYSEDRVDLTLIRWMLSLTPAERLSFHEERINEILAIRELNKENASEPGTE